MPRFKLMEENVTRSIVFERSEVMQVEEYAFSQRRSLSSVVRDAVALYMAQVVNRESHVTQPPDDGTIHPQSMS